MFGAHKTNATAAERRLEQAEDEATEALQLYWFQKYSDQLISMFAVDANGDSRLCDEAQEVFNNNYNP